MSDPSFLTNQPSYGDGINWRGNHPPQLIDTVVRAQFRAWQPCEAVAGDEDVKALAGLCEATEGEFRAMVDTLGTIGADTDPSLNKDGRQKIAARIIEPKLERFARRAEADIARADAAINREHEAINAASRPTPEMAHVDNAIRAHWLALDPIRRTAQSLVLHELDTDTLRALTVGPAYLSGLDAAAQERLRTELGRRVVPERMARLEALQQGRAAAVAGLATLDAKARKFIDFVKARKLAEREANRYG